MTSMKNVQFLHTHPLPPFYVCPNGSKLGKSPRPWTLKLRLPTTPTTPYTPLPFGICAAYQLYLVDVSITYHARATHNSLQLKINLN